MKADNNKYWTAFYTKPRNEKKVAERLNDSGYEIYCPVRTVLKQWSDRKKKVKEVLFTSYIFGFVDENQRKEILKDQGVVSSVFWLNRPVKIPNDEIQAIQSFLDENPSAEAVSVPQIGDKIQISSGPLKGEGGVVQKIKGNKIVLLLDVLGVSLQAEVPSSQLV